MGRDALIRLQELFEEAWSCYENEWSFGEFTAIVEKEKQEADEIFKKLLDKAS